MGLAYELAVASSQIVTTVVEATEFPDLAARYQVSGVPKTVVNDTIELLGVQSEDVLVAQVTQESQKGTVG